jgi:DNA-binding MarR family transcriptional regulator
MENTYPGENARVCMDRERDDSGRYSETVPPDVVLEVFSDSEPRTTSEVADSLDMAQRTVFEKLKTLQERGDIRKKSIGELAVVWWRPEPPE